MGLEVDPKTVRHPEVPGQPEGRVGGDASPTLDDSGDPRLRHIEILGKPVLTDTHRVEKLR